jgi:hypothetical protein
MMEARALVTMNRYAWSSAAALAAIAAAVGANAETPASAQHDVLLAQAEPQGQPGPPTPQQRVMMLKQWLQASQEQLRSYEWIETTVITEGGEERSRKQNTCYYGVDGGLQKVPVAGAYDAATAAPPAVLPPGRLLKRVEQRKDQATKEYLESAAALVHSYIPPDPNRIQQAVNGGRLAVNMVDPGRRVRLDFRDYLKPGDVLGIEIEVPTNRLLGLHVSSYLDDPKDAVDLDVRMGVLPDGTIYIARSTLNAPAKDVTVTIENTGYHRSEG